MWSTFKQQAQASYPDLLHCILSLIKCRSVLGYSRQSCGFGRLVNWWLALPVLWWRGVRHWGRRRWWCACPSVPSAPHRRTAPVLHHPPSDGSGGGDLIKTKSWHNEIWFLDWSDKQIEQEGRGRERGSGRDIGKKRESGGGRKGAKREPSMKQELDSLVCFRGLDWGDGGSAF